METYEEVRVEPLSQEEAEQMEEMFSSRAWKMFQVAVLNKLRQPRYRTLKTASEIQNVFQAQGGLEVLDMIQSEIARLAQELIDVRSNE